MTDITGTSDGETLNGTSGDDVITGLGGADTLNGSDGHDVLYGDFAEPEGFVRVSVNSDGDQATGVSGASYVSPDGQTVLFWSQADNLAGDVATGYGLFAYDRATGDVTRVAINTTTPTELAFSPDGTMITYLAGGNSGANGYAYVLDLETEAVALVSVRPDGNPAFLQFSPEFSADGESILAVSGQLSGEISDSRPIFVTEWALTGGAPIDSTELGYAGENSSGGSVSFSSDGALVVVAMTSGDSRSVRLFDTATGDQLALIGQHELEDGGTLKAVFSPDNSQVAWSSPTGVYIYDIATGMSRTLALSPMDNDQYDSVQFALDGTALVVAADTPRGDEIWLIDIASGNVTVLARGRNAQVSADGTYITFSSTATNLVPGDTNAKEDVFLLNLPGAADGDSDTLNGGAGNDVLNGGGGADVMNGGTGNDTYYIDNAGDVLTEAKGEGADLAYASVSYVLQAGVYVDNLTLTGSADINGTGNGIANILTGNSGINVLAGGKGNDTYVIQNTDDVVNEIKGEGADLILSSVSFVMKAGSYVENLTLTGSANINGTGNGLSNIIRGNTGNNVLDGGSGGSDKFYGGLGDDVYYVNSSGDQIFELKGQGEDTIYSSISYTLAVGSYVETLVLTGTANLNGTGNGASNILRGNAGDNVLDGGSGGSDDFYGGLGDDTYYVNSAGDLVFELKGQGEDKIFSSVSFTLRTGSYVETLELTGTANINGTGNGASNTLRGNGGDNTLNGGAAADILIGRGGADVLTGGTGGDTFVFTSVQHSKVTESDRITDLSNSDFIDLSEIDANTNAAGMQHFVLVDAFTNTAGQVTLSYDGTFTNLNADINGDGVSDMLIRIDGNHEDFDNFIFGG